MTAYIANSLFSLLTESADLEDIESRALIECRTQGPLINKKGLLEVWGRPERDYRRCSDIALGTVRCMASHFNALSQRQ